MEPFIIITILFAGAFISLLLKQRSIIEFIAAVASLISLGAAISIAFKVASGGTYTPSPLFSIDALGAIVLLIVSFVGFLSSLYSIAYLRAETKQNIIGFHRVRQYFVLCNLFLATMFTATMSANPVLTWIFVEATTLSTAFLISFYNKPSSTEAAWKYLIINSVGLLLGFFGTLLYLTSVQSLPEHSLITWSLLTANAQHLNPLVAQIAFIFILIGYGTKMGLAPMHTWLPDAHGKAPAPISALLSGVLLNVAFLVIVRFKNITDTIVGKEYTQNLFIVFALSSILIAAFVILTQRNYKRLLAYSSIENMGVMALGFGLGGLGIFAAILHMIYHSLIKSSLFFAAGNILLRYRSTKIREVTGMLSNIPSTAIVFMAGFLAVVGLPPFGLFFTKIYILSAGMQHHLVVTGATILLLAILFIGFLRHVTSMLFGEKQPELAKEKESVWLVIPPATLIIIALLLSLYMPPLLNSLIHSAVAQYSL